MQFLEKLANSRLSMEIFRDSLTIIFQERGEMSRDSRIRYAEEIRTGTDANNVNAFPAMRLDIVNGQANFVPVVVFEAYWDRRVSSPPKRLVELVKISNN